MSNEQSTVTYSVAEILGQINQKLDRMDERLTNLAVGQARLEEKVDHLSQKVETVEKRYEGIENGQKSLFNDVADLKGAKSLIVPIVVATLTSLLTRCLNS